MTILTFQTPYLCSNMYLLAENGHGLIIDPCEDAAFCAQIDEKEQKIDRILLTHEHYDHISGTNALRERFDCPVLCGAVCAERIQNSVDNFSHYFQAYASLQTGEAVPENLTIDESYTTHADESFSGERELLWQGHCLLLRETPGHSPGSSCILLDGDALFSGDSLLPGGQAMVRFPGSSKRQYENVALPWLQSLSPEITVYPGHYGSFRLGDHPEYHRRNRRTKP